MTRGGERRSRRASCAGGSHGRGFWSDVGEFFAALFAQVAVTLGLGSSASSRAYAISDAQKFKLNALALRACVAFDRERVEHTDALRKLWRLALGGEAPKDLKSERWKEMGWQGTSPETDFRAGGYMSLENLVWFAEKEPERFKALWTKANGRRSQFEYPFAVAAVNLTFNLVEMFEVKQEGPTTAAGACFARLIDLDDEAFERAYVLAFETLDREWLSYPGGATYMDFPVVLKATKERLARAMNEAKTLEEVRANLD